MNDETRRAAAPTEPHRNLLAEQQEDADWEELPPPDRGAGLRAALLAEFDGSLCPACHCRAHDPGGCSNCPRCELHTDEAAAFVLRFEPALIDSEGLDVERLARAIRNVDEKHSGIDAITLAAEYARLTKYPEEPTDD